MSTARGFVASMIARMSLRAMNFAEMLDFTIRIDYSSQIVKFYVVKEENDRVSC